LPVEPVQETPDSKGNIMGNRHVSFAAKDSAQFFFGILQYRLPRPRKVLPAFNIEVAD
jgi:hypothetical protein